MQTPPPGDAAPVQVAADVAQQVHLDPIALVLHASGPVFVVFWGLVLMAAGVWVIAVMKFLQLARMRSSRSWSGGRARGRCRGWGRRCSPPRRSP